jgi:hypothetical protein
MTAEIRILANVFTNIKRTIYFSEQSRRAVVYLTCTDDKEVIIKAFVVQVLYKVSLEYWQQQKKANGKSNVLL